MIRLAVRVGREHVDVATAELLVLSPGGLEERDLGDGTVELAIYGAEGELPDLPDIRAAAGDALVEVSTSQVADDWDARWREWHNPIDVGPLRVRPPWGPQRPGALDVTIEPGQAFGTGRHPSTRLALELLVTVPARGPLADWGCGSGVLSVAAARLGFAPVLACDVEPQSIAATLASAKANDVPAVAVAAFETGSLAPANPGMDADHAATATGIVAAPHDLRAAPGPWAPTVIANLFRPLLLDLAARIEEPPERMIVAGVVVEEADEVAAAFAACGLATAARRDEDGWSAILLSR